MRMRRQRRAMCYPQQCVSVAWETVPVTAHLSRLGSEICEGIGSWWMAVNKSSLNQIAYDVAEQASRQGPAFAAMVYPGDEYHAEQLNPRNS